jgi:hypothetical protein
MLEQLLHALTAVDGRLLRTFRRLVNQPGALTLAYVQGQRVPYIGPFQLFIIANVLFVALQTLIGVNIFSSPLDSHLQRQDWSDLAQTLVARHIETSQTSLEQFAPHFDRAVAVYAKWLIILMVLPFALLLPVLFYRERQAFVTHAVFALHLYTVLLLLFCASLLIACVDLAFGGGGLESAYMDNVLSLFNLTGCALYLFFATQKVYGARGASRIGKVLVLSGAVGLIALGYRFALFLLTLYTL